MIKNTLFEEAEKLGLPKRVHIPFENQNSYFVQLIRKFENRFIHILQVTHSTMYTPISLYNEEAVSNVSKLLTADSSWSLHLIETKQFTDMLREFRLVHLQPVDFHIDKNGKVFLVCSYDSKGLDKYIPYTVKTLHASSDELFNKLINTPVEKLTEKDLRGLWWFTSFAYIVSCFGDF